MMNFKFKKLFSLALVFVLALSLVACGKNEKKEDDKSTGSETEGKQEINMMTWGGDFVPRDIISEFESETGIKVNYKEVNSNEEMQTLLETNPEQYDLAVVTDYMIDIMAKNGNLEKLNKESLPNFSNINPVYQGNYYDENNEYSIPYAVSTSLLLVNPKAVEELGAKPITSYGDLWQPELENKVVIVDWSVEVMGVVLKSLGYEYNETDPAIVQEAKDKLFELRKNIVRFETNTPENSLIDGEAVAGFMYSNQAVKGMEQNTDLEAVFPTEGMPIFIDSFVMSKGSPNKENAYKLLDYLLNPEVSAKISDKTKFTNANKAATEFLPEEFKNNPVLNLSDEVVNNTAFYINVADVTEEYDHIYSEFKMQ